jgi:hypothetical protein
MAEESGSKIVFDKYPDTVRYVVVAALTLFAALGVARSAWILVALAGVAALICAFARNRLTIFLHEGMIELDRSLGKGPTRTVIPIGGIKDILLDFVDTSSKSSTTRTYQALFVFTNSSYAPFAFASNTNIEQVVEAVKAVRARIPVAVEESPKLTDLRHSFDCLAELAEVESPSLQTPKANAVDKPSSVVNQR